MPHTQFKTSAHAKCILAGEHAVIRGCPALVLPILSKTISLSYQESNNNLEIQCHTHYEETFRLFFWHTFLQGLHYLKKDHNEIHGKFIIKNNISMGAGIGFSSALCMVITRWFIWAHWLNERKLFDFAKCLENIFHGQSSGVDIAGVIADHIIHFEKPKRIYEVKTNWQPELYISYSGYMKSTEGAVNRVKSIRRHHAKLAKAIDNEMKESVAMIEESLMLDKKNGLKLLKIAIEHANHCFEQWQLITPELQQHMNALYDLGALAVKPTGSGLGGYVLSLWEQAPPKDSKIKLLSLRSK